MAPRSQAADGEEKAALQRVVEASLGPRLAAPVLSVLQMHHARLTALEASIRRTRSGQIHGGRMMIERAGLPLALGLADALDVVVPAHVREAAEAAAGQGLPIIAGWDASRPLPSVKLYINASDASAEVRRRIARGLALPDVLDAPHVVGFNLHAQDDPIEGKAYVQSRNAREAAEALGGAAEWLADVAEGLGLVAGAVSCWDVAGQQARPRAFFVALRDGADDGGALLVGRLPGWSAARADACVPFERGPARSVGVGLQAGAGAGGAEVWTAYFKPKASRRSLWAIEPAACFRAGAVEIGVFVEPVEHAVKAFVRTERHALSYRLRQGSREAIGQEPPAALVKLMAWAENRVRVAERAGDIAACLRAAPPPPWEIVLG